MSWPDFPRLPRLYFSDRDEFNFATDDIRYAAHDIGYSDMAIILHEEAVESALAKLGRMGITKYEFVADEAITNPS